MKRNWPEEKHVAVLFTIMFEGWEEGAAPGVGPMGNALKPGYYDTANAGWAKYAANNGLERQLKILKEEGIKASVFCSGVQMERHPDLIKKIAAEGHEVCLHSLAQNIIPIYLDEATEREQMSHCLDLAVSLTGKHPVGYCSPRCTPSLSTSKLLAENGLKYTIDWMGSDLPMVEHTEAGDICLMPFPMNVNDMPKRNTGTAGAKGKGSGTKHPIPCGRVLKKEEEANLIGDIQNSRGDLVWLSDPDIGKALDVLNAALKLDCAKGSAENMAVCGDPVDDLFFGVFGIPVIKLIYQVSVILVGRVAIADI